MIKKTIRKLTNKLGYDITRRRDPFIDMKKFLHNDQPIVFDVGANIGQSIQKFRKEFPKCAIHSFEPSPMAFEELTRHSVDYKDIYLWNFALGEHSGRMALLEES